MIRGIRDRIGLHESYKRIFETPDGERVLRHLVRVSNMMSSSFVPGDPHQTAFKEGQRHVVLSILTFINKDHTELIKQIEEMENESENDAL